MEVILNKTLPISGTYYSSGGEVSISIKGVKEVVIHTKKNLTNIQKVESPNKQNLKPSDEFNNLILDLKKGVDEINIIGWLEDDENDTAWNKFWKLRAMCSRGGPLNNFVLGDKIFDSSTQEVFLEDVQGVYNPDDTGNIHHQQAKDVARMQVRLNLLVGGAR